MIFFSTNLDDVVTLKTDAILLVFVPWNLFCVYYNEVGICRTLLCRSRLKALQIEVDILWSLFVNYCRRNSSVCYNTESEIYCVFLIVECLQNLGQPPEKYDLHCALHYVLIYNHYEPHPWRFVQYNCIIVNIVTIEI